MTAARSALYVRKLESERLVGQKIGIRVFGPSSEPVMSRWRVRRFLIEPSQAPKSPEWTTSGIFRIRSPAGEAVTRQPVCPVKRPDISGDA